MQVVNGIGISDKVFTSKQCSEWIQVFDSNVLEQYEGYFTNCMDKNLKHVTEMAFKDSSTLTTKLNISLVEYMKEYIKNIEWDYTSIWHQKTVWDKGKYKKYLKGEGHYNHIHQERDGWYELSARLFSVLVYLNTVEDGGETVFPLHDVSCSPMVGRICIWPSGFPYLHYGKMPVSDSKYAINTWLCYDYGV